MGQARIFQKIETCIPQDVDLNKKRPQYIKAKEKTAHMVKKLESAK